MRYLVVRTENLTKEYRRRRVLSNLTLEIEPGEVFGVLGPKGAGKSSLVNILLDIVHPTSGSAMVMGLDCQRQSIQVRRLVGHMPQSLSFPSGVTGRQLLTRMMKLRGQVDQEYFANLIERFKINLDKRLSISSSTEQRKFGLLQAVMHQPDLVLFDEPTQSLDSETRFELMRLVAEMRIQGTAVLFSSSSLADMEHICDRVAFLHAGNLISIERGVQLRQRAMRKVELRFAAQVQPEWFSGLVNLKNVVCDKNKLYCTLQGDPDALIKAVSQYRVLDFISRQPSLEEVYQSYYGIEAHAS